jgi:protein-disulfide isomerase
MNRNVVLSFVVVLAILAGVSLTVIKTNSPAMDRIVTQQDQIMASQKALREDIQKVLLAAPAGASATAGAGQSGLEQRVALLENKVDAILKALQNQGGQGAQQQGPPPEDYTKVYDLNTAGGHVRGKKDAPITVVEFTDLQCPFCARFHSLSTDLLAAFPDKVKYVMKNYPLPFHKMAMPAAKAALAAGDQGKYFEMVDMILDNNRKLSDPQFTKDSFKDFAAKIGLNVDQFEKDLKEKDAQYAKMIQQDMMDAQKAQVRGTPTFFLQGHKTRARDITAFKAEIENELKKLN